MKLTTCVVLLIAAMVGHAVHAQGNDQGLEARINAMRAAYREMKRVTLDPQNRLVVITATDKYLVVSFIFVPAQRAERVHMVYDPVLDEIIYTTTN